MNDFLDNKRNKILITIAISVILLVSIILVLTGKIDLKKIMGNTAQGEYTCPENSKLEGDNCIIDVEPTYICNNGGTLRDKSCVVTTTTSNSSNCPSGTIEDKSTSKCYVYPKKQDNYTCQEGNLIGKECRKDSKIEYIYSCGIGAVKGSKCEMAPIPKSYYCPNGGTLNTTTKKCTKTMTSTSRCNGTITGTPPNQSCTYTASVLASAGYTCPSGWVQNNGVCQKNATVSRNYRTCDLGWNLSADESYCTHAANNRQIDVCPDNVNYRLEEGKCTTSRISSSNITCSVGNLSSDKSECTYDAQASTDYTCPNEYTSIGNNKCSKKATLIDNKVLISLIKVKLEKDVLGVNEKTSIIVESILPENASEKTLVYSSSNPNIVVVDTNGLVTAIAVGEAEIIAKSNDGTNIETKNKITVKNNTVQTVPDTKPTEPQQNTNTGSKPSPTIKKEINAKITYSCDSNSGYKLNGTSCEKIEYKTASKTYTCPLGYSKSGSQCVRQDVKNATLTYKCESGYTLNKTTKKCEKQSMVDVSNAEYVCQEGYELIYGTSKCISVQVMKQSTSCSYNIIGNECLKYEIVLATKGSRCPNGYEEKDGKCIGKTYVDAIINYVCPSKYKAFGKICNRTITINVSTKGYCPSEYKYDNGKCIKTTTIAANKNYSCDAGYKLNETKCIKVN